MSRRLSLPEPLQFSIDLTSNWKFTTRNFSFSNSPLGVSLGAIASLLPNLNGVGSIVSRIKTGILLLGVASVASAAEVNHETLENAGCVSVNRGASTAFVISEGFWRNYCIQSFVEMASGHHLAPQLWNDCKDIVKSNFTLLTETALRSLHPPFTSRKMEFMASFSSEVSDQFSELVRFVAQTSLREQSDFYENKRLYLLCSFIMVCMAHFLWVALFYARNSNLNSTSLARYFPLQKLAATCTAISFFSTFLLNWFLEGNHSEWNSQLLGVANFLVGVLPVLWEAVKISERNTQTSLHEEEEELPLNPHH